MGAGLPAGSRPISHGKVAMPEDNQAPALVSKRYTRTSAGLPHASDGSHSENDMDVPEPTRPTEKPDDWVSESRRNFAQHPTTQKAWRKLQSSGLEDSTWHLLRGYAAGADTVMDQLTKEAIRLLDAAVRAERVAQQSSPKCAHDPDLFRRRAREARNAALGAKWPTPSAGIYTLRDELELVKKETGKEYPLAVVQKVLNKTAGLRSRVDSPMYFLMLLKGHAAQHGVNLGVKTLAALADCVCPNHLTKSLDPSTLARYLRLYSPSDVVEILRRTPLPGPRLKHQ